MNGRVLARREADEVCFVVIGQVTCHHSPAMRQYAEDADAAGATRAQVDLSDCTYCDSTFLGTLLGLKRRFDRHNKGGLRLICPSSPLRQMLAQFGAERLFEVVEHGKKSDIQTTWQQLECQVERANTPRFKRNVVEAHEELVAAGGELAKRFGPVAEAVRQELDGPR
jgi:anti-sigma B factor antagonist